MQKGSCPKKVEQGVTIYPNNSKKNEIYFHTNIHSSIIRNSQKLETTQLSTNWWKDKPSVVHLYDGVLPGNEKEGCTDTFHNMDELWKQDAQWKKPDTNTTCWVIPFIWNTRDRLIYRDQK